MTGEEKLLISVIEKLEAERDRYKKALENIRDNFDHDSDAHKYGTSCREWLAREALKEVE